jgi:hypothetical protein
LAGGRDRRAFNSVLFPTLLLPAKAISGTRAGGREGGREGLTARGRGGGRSSKWKEAVAKRVEEED